MSVIRSGIGLDNGKMNPRTGLYTRELRMKCPSHNAETEISMNKFEKALGVAHCKSPGDFGGYEVTGNLPLNQ